MYINLHPSTHTMYIVPIRLYDSFIIYSFIHLYIRGIYIVGVLTSGGGGGGPLSKSKLNIGKRKAAVFPDPV